MKRTQHGLSVFTLAAAGAVVLAGSSTALAQKKDSKPAAPKQAPAKPPAAKACAVDPAKSSKATDKAAEAKKLFGLGEKLVAAEDWACAALAFKTADSLQPDPRPKYKMATALDKVQASADAASKPAKVLEAIAAYKSFLSSYEALAASAADADKARAEKQKAKADEARGRVEELAKTPGSVTIRLQGPGALEAPSVKVDDKEVPGTPGADNTTVWTVALAPGSHRVAAAAKGMQAATQEVTLTTAEAKEITVALAPAPVAAVETVTPPPTTDPAPTATATEAPPPPVPAPAPKQERSKVPAIVTLSLAGAGAVLGGVFGGLALDSKGKFDATPTTALADETDRNALIADMSFAVAITFAVTGTVLLLTGDEKAADQKALVGPRKAAAKAGPKAFVAPLVSPTMGGASLMLSF
jgi:hypothetical protein